MIGAICHQVPAMAAELARLGMFYVWHTWQAIPVASWVCHLI